MSWFTFILSALVLLVGLSGAEGLQKPAHPASRSGSEGGVRLQRTDFDCGPTSLEVILEERGLKIPIEEIRRRAGTTSYGTSMLGLKQCAESFGLPATGWIFGRSDLPSIPLPAIIFLESRHFAVLREVREDDVRVFDPLLGEVVWTITDLCRKWSGKTLVVGSLERR